MRKLFFILLLLTSGCVPLSAGTPPSTLIPTQTPPPTETPVPTATVPEPTSTPSIPPLTADQLKNATYTLPVYEQTITLQDGTFLSGEGPTQISVRLQDSMAFGDMDGDGVEDAAVLLAENGGGTGVFVSLIVMLNRDGQPVQSGAALVDDRPQILSLRFENGLITVDAVIHGTNDPGCCPNFSVSETYIWQAEALTLVHFTSQTPDGSPRIIEITSSSDPAAQPYPITGTVTIAPFENTLVYKLIDSEGNVVTEGPIQVNAQEMGGPGTFDTTVDLPDFSGRYRLVVQDLSAADGSILAMDSIIVER